MGTRSFFVEPGDIQGGIASLRGELSHQIRNVLRLRPGDTVDLLDNSGEVAVSRIVELSKEGVVAEVVERRRVETEPVVRLELYQALLKGEKMEMVLQKGTEIGVSRFVPVLSERCISRPTAQDLERKLKRWREIVREAAEQSGRGILPEVAPLQTLETACRSAVRSTLGLFAWEEERARGIGSAIRAAGIGDATSFEKEGPPRVALLVGPEGGFSAGEAEAAREAGLQVVSLGPRILRAETAAIVGATLVLASLGEMGG